MLMTVSLGVAEGAVVLLLPLSGSNDNQGNLDADAKLRMQWAGRIFLESGGTQSQQLRVLTSGGKSQ